MSPAFGYVFYKIHPYTQLFTFHCLQCTYACLCPCPFFLFASMFSVLDVIRLTLGPTRLGVCACLYKHS